MREEERKEGREEGRKEGTKECRKEGTKEGRKKARTLRKGYALSPFDNPRSHARIKKHKG